MKILIDARESGSSTGRYIDKLLVYLMKIDSKNEYHILLKPHRLEAYKNNPSNFNVVKCDVKEFTFAEQLKLLKQIKSLKADLVHFGIVQQPILYRGKVVTTMHDLTTLRFTNKSKNVVLFKVKQFVYRYVNKIVAKKSVSVITPSEFVKNDIINFTGVNPDKIIVTYEAADFITEEAEIFNPLINKQFIMYVGRHQPHKNLDRLIEAHQRLIKENPGLTLAIVGKKDATTELLEKKIDTKGYKNVVFTDFVSDSQLRWLYENTACYVFPSLSEGFGLPGLEAMVHGAPVASSNATCLPEIYGDGALYFDPLDTDDIADKISQIISDTKLREELIHRGFRQCKKYSWKRMAEQTLEVYEKSI